MIYLVLEYENRLVYIPFKDLACIDEFTTRFDNPLELCAIINDYLDLDIPRSEMLDAYLSEDINNIYDDMQEYNKRYLAIKYKRDNYDNLDLGIKFTNFIRFNIEKANLFIGLDKVIDHYKEKYCKYRKLMDKDISKIALAYLGSDYKRRKECYYKLKDLGYRTKTNEFHIDYAETSIKELEEEDKMLLVLLTNMTIQELKEYVSNQDNKGRKR